MSQQYIDLIGLHLEGKLKSKPESETSEPLDWMALVEAHKHEYALYNHVSNMLEEAMRDGIF